MHVTSRNDFAGGSCRRVRRGRCARGLLAIREPVALVGALVRIEDDDAPVAGVGDEHFVGGGVVRDRGRTVQRRLAVGAVHFSRRADLQQELAVARELEHVSVAGHGRRGCRACTGARRCLAAGGSRIVGPAAPTWRRRLQARRRNPDVALGINGEAARRLRPGVARARSAPARDEHALLIEFEHERRGADSRGRPTGE